mgnify:FL=1
MCNEHSATIDADNYKRCDPDGALNYKENDNTRDCAQAQLYVLALRCWDMMGRADIDYGWIKNVGDLDTCFRFTVRDLSSEIDEDTFTNWMIKNKKCERLENNNILGGHKACGNADRVDWAGNILSGTEKINSGECWRISFNPRPQKQNRIKFKPC